MDLIYLRNYKNEPTTNKLNTDNFLNMYLYIVWYSEYQFGDLLFLYFCEIYVASYNLLRALHIFPYQFLSYNFATLLVDNFSINYRHPHVSYKQQIVHIPILLHLTLSETSIYTLFDKIIELRSYH